jgi:hypothetical protein
MRDQGAPTVHRDEPTKFTADAVYDILVEECGATESWRTYFRTSWMEHSSDYPDYPFEYRFSGSLGFGGKFYDSGGCWYVAYYPEDKTAEREAMVAAAQPRIEALQAQKRGSTT